jgi:dTDP-4-dehydrorhamnose reductase
MKKLLLTGAAGFLGWNCCKIASPLYKVYGIYHIQSVFGEISNYKQCDLTDQGAVKHLFDEIQPDLVIHTAAASDPNFCQNNQSLAEKINVEATLLLASLCADLKIPFVFTSTDLVFDGTGTSYNEHSPVNPISIYGEQKLKAEMGIQKVYPDAAICRMPLMYGDSPASSKRFLQMWLEQLREGKQLTLFIDEFRTPVSAIDACRGLLLAAEKVHGIIHLGGRERISRYDFGLLVTNCARLPSKQIAPVRQDEIKMAAPRPRDVSLDSTKAYNLGYTPGIIKEELLKLECCK